MTDDHPGSVAPPGGPESEPETPGAKRARGKPFEKGNRANPGGRPRSDPALRLALDRLSLEAAKVLGELLRNPRTPRAVRARVCEYLLDRRLGRPTVAVGGIDGQALIPPGTEAAYSGTLGQIFANLRARRAAEAAAEDHDSPAEANASPGASGEATGRSS